MKLSEFSIKSPVFTLVIMFLIIILGVVSFTRIPITLIPELNPPIGVVVTNYPGASPTEVSEKVTKPLEANLSTLPGIKSIQSNSQEGSNFILLERSEEHTSELQSREKLVCRLLLEKKNNKHDDRI